MDPFSKLIKLLDAGIRKQEKLQPLAVTYHHKGKRSMVSDTSNRIRGVEQFLDKWAPVLENWVGREGREHFVKGYRLRVLGNLAVQKLLTRSIREPARLGNHLIRKNGVSAVLPLIKQVIRRSVRSCTPRVILVWMTSVKNTHG